MAELVKRTTDSTAGKGSTQVSNFNRTETFQAVTDTKSFTGRTSTVVEAAAEVVTEFLNVQEVVTGAADGPSTEVSQVKQRYRYAMQVSFVIPIRGGEGVVPEGEEPPAPICE